MRRNRGFTLIELLTVMAIISLLIGLLLPALAQARAKAQLTKDQAQIKQIHASWIAFAREYEGAFPTPGLIYRLPVPEMDDVLVPGRGPERLEENFTGPMFSVSIMQNYFSPQLTIGPTEPSGYVLVKDDYDWDLYDPLGENGDPTYWDIDFLTKLNTLCNTSYSHTPICGRRKFEQWNDSMDAKFIVLGNRGPENGAQTSSTNYTLDETLYYDSLTLEIHGGRKEWAGNIGFNDNHLEFAHSLTPEGVTYFNISEDRNRPDNIFNNNDGTNQQTGDGRDSWLVIQASTWSDPTQCIMGASDPQWD